jgi:fibro-slime domain-containing protein
MGRFLRCTSLVAVSYSLFIVGCASSEGTGLGPNGGNGSTGGGGNVGGGTGVPTGSGIPEDLKNCGNGKQDATEQCDDGNKEDKDGCNRLCQIAADYQCPEWGKPCTNTAVCGDGFLSSSEACDDKNTVDGDGCSADCQTVAPGWRCRAGKPCTSICGDSNIVEGVETCDDGNKESGDGCSSTCVTEPGYSCTGTPSTCTAASCGNGEKETGEACDLGKDLNGLFHGDGTGCSRTCTQEPTCRDETGKTSACVTRCGDGNIDTNRDEECDDGNGVTGDGCSAECKKEDGFTCVDKTKKDAQPCSSGTGDCLQLPITYRDFDGANLTTGHPDFLYMLSTPKGGTRTYCVPNASSRVQGSSGSCPGNDSTDLCLGLTKPELNSSGKPEANTAGGLKCACQFTDWDKTYQGASITQQQLVAAGFTFTTCSSGGSGEIWSVTHPGVQVIQSADSFKQWYTDSDYSTKYVGVLELEPTTESDNAYQYTASNGRTLYDDIHDIWLKQASKPAVSSPPATSLTSGFFPLESATGAHATKMCNLWPYWALTAAQTTSCTRDQWDARADTDPAKAGAEGTNATAVQGVKRNYYFTTEARYLFRYVGGETLKFHGDDDVWVYVNGKLVLDIGATHERLEGTVTLSDTGASAVIRSEDVVTGKFTVVGQTQKTTGLGLVPGNTYEIAIFHADHHPRDSNYQLTLTGFSRTYSECKPTCGDGVVTVGEECDDGEANNTGAYNGCKADCTYAPYCGDGNADAPDEDCDKGRDNTGEYGTDGCTPACKRAHFCGDGFLDVAAGEECDGGGQASAGCDASCHVIIQ